MRCLCHQASVSHVPSNMNIEELGRTCMCAQIVFNVAQQARPKRRKHLRKERLGSTAVETRVTVRTETALEENLRAFQEYVQPQSDYSLDRKCPLILRSAKRRQVQLTLILEEKRQESTLNLGKTKD